MTTRTLFRGAMVCVLMTSSALTPPALAQTQAEPPHRVIDANGVDLISGTFPFNLTEGAIGSGESALTVERHGVTPGGTGNWQNMFVSQTISGSVTYVAVILGDHGENFTSTSGGAFVSVQGTGATLTGGSHTDFTYTASDGTVIVFGAPTDDHLGASNLCSHARPIRTDATDWQRRSRARTPPRPISPGTCTQIAQPL